MPFFPPWKCFMCCVGVCGVADPEDYWTGMASLGKKIYLWAVGESENVIFLLFFKWILISQCVFSNLCYIFCFEFWKYFQNILEYFPTWYPHAIVVNKDSCFVYSFNMPAQVLSFWQSFVDYLHNGTSKFEICVQN